MIQYKSKRVNALAAFISIKKTNKKQKNKKRPIGRRIRINYRKSLHEAITIIEVN